MDCNLTTSGGGIDGIYATGIDELQVGLYIRFLTAAGAGIGVI